MRIIPIQPDDEVTTRDGRQGYVIGIDGNRITVLGHGGFDRFTVTDDQIVVAVTPKTR